MVITTYFEYACSCGEIGKYSTTSYDGFYRFLGIGQKKPPTCIRCEVSICKRCKRGSFCSNCAKDLSPIIKGLLTLFNILTVLGGIFVIFALMLLLNVGDIIGNIGIDSKIPVTIIITYIAARIAQIIMKESIKKDVELKA